MLKHLTALLLAPLALAACVEATPDTGAEGSGDSRPLFPTGESDTCQAARVVPVIGQGAGALATTGNRMDPVRLIRPDQAVTMDYISTRLNVELDAQDRIIRLSCG